VAVFNAPDDTLFDSEPEEDYNELERKVAWHLEDQRKLFFWFRNHPRRDYAIQAWQKHKIYPDFIAAADLKDDPIDFDRIYVIETKGEHLEGAEKTNYKKEVFKLCNKLAQPKSWSDLGLELPEKLVSFHWIEQDQWQQKISDLFS